MSDSAFLGAASANATAVSTDAVTVTVAGVAWGGWESVSIVRGLETVPSSFILAGTELYPGQLGATKVAINSGSPCIVKIGSSTILTGYVDRTEREYDARQHDIRVTGRSKLADLVDSSGFTKSWQLQNLTLGNIASTICKPFGITVSTPDGDTAAIPSLSVILTQTGWEFLEEACRWMTKLIYDDVDGNLVIANLSTSTHASGVVEGVNVQRVRADYDLAEVYTEIAAIFSDTAMLSDNLVETHYEVVDQAQATNGNFPKRLDGQARYRPLLIVSEQGPGYDQVVPERIKWEMARRIGRSQAIMVTVDNWRDSAGNLWNPNWLVPVNLPNAKLASKTWLIAQVTYIRDEEGTRAELVLMPPTAVAAMPEAPFEYDPALADAASSPTTGAQTPPTVGDLY